MTAPRASRAHGFTLIEVMVVVAVIGLVLRIVMVNLGALVPQTRLESASKQLVAVFEEMRIESRVQGKRYGVEIDLKQPRWRRTLPEEERLTSELTVEQTAAREMSWHDLEPGVMFRGAGSSAEPIARNGLYRIQFDENGFTADQVVFLGLQDDDKLICTVQIRGLASDYEILVDTNGVEHRPELVQEMGF